MAIVNAFLGGLLIATGASPGWSHALLIADVILLPGVILAVLLRLCCCVAIPARAYVGAGSMDPHDNVLDDV